MQSLGSFPHHLARRWLFFCETPFLGSQGGFGGGRGRGGRDGGGRGDASPRLEVVSLGVVDTGQGDFEWSVKVWWTVVRETLRGLSGLT